MQHNNTAAGDSSELQLCILQGSITISLAFIPPAAKAQATTAKKHTDRPACSEHYGTHHNSPRGRGAPVTVPEPSRRTCGRNKRVPQCLAEGRLPSSQPRKHPLEPHRDFKESSPLTPATKGAAALLGLSAPADDGAAPPPLRAGGPGAPPGGRSEPGAC